nr:DNA directed RNA polymerase III subunit [Hymenolepis microstoma]
MANVDNRKIAFQRFGCLPVVLCSRWVCTFMNSLVNGRLCTVALDVDFTNTKLLSNFEVYDFIKNRAGSKDKLRCQQTLFFTGLKYFNEKSPCTCLTSDAIQKFISEMKPFNLNKAELLSLINNCPATQVELSIMINDLDTRFTLAQIDEILDKVASCFPDGIKKASQIASSGVAEDGEGELRDDNVGVEEIV